MRRVAPAVLVLAVVAGGTAFAIHRSRPGAPPPTADASVATATVRRTNLAATQLIDATLGYAASAPVIVRRTGTYTWLPAEGSLIEPGRAVAAVDGRPVMLLLGSVGAWRSFTTGMTDGDDVAQLERNLSALGFGGDMTVDRHFTAATRAAVRRWQTSLGEQATGVVQDGDVVFLPAPIRVGPASTAVGAPTQPGEAPYVATSTTRVAQANLDAARQAGIRLGSAVTIDLAGGRRTAGRVAALGTVATVASGNNGSSNGDDRPTVPLTISLDDPAAAGTLDQQPVQIELVTDSRTNVLAVPVTALLALAEGSYGVEVVPRGGPHTIVAVTTGLYASGLVEITHGVAAGTVVVVAH